MSKQISLEEAKGKTLTGFCVEFDHAILVFGDRYVCLEIVRGYEEGDSTIEEAKDHWEGCSDIRSLLVELGINTREEVRAFEEQEEARNQIFRETRERKEYERLRKKFGG